MYSWLHMVWISPAGESSLSLLKLSMLWQTHISRALICLHVIVLRNVLVHSVDLLTPYNRSLEQKFSIKPFATYTTSNSMQCYDYAHVPQLSSSLCSLQFNSFKVKMCGECGNICTPCSSDFRERRHLSDVWSLALKFKKLESLDACACVITTSNKHSSPRTKVNLLSLDGPGVKHKMKCCVQFCNSGNIKARVHFFVCATLPIGASYMLFSSVHFIL